MFCEHQYKINGLRERICPIGFLPIAPPEMLAFIVALLLSPVVLATPSRRASAPRCGTHPSDQQVADSELRFASKRPSAVALVSGPIPVHWHVISSGTTYAKGNVPQQQVVDSVTALNEAFQPTGFTFVLANVTRTVNAQWFANANIETPAQRTMKQRLRVGNEATLNVYTVQLPDILGYATFPSWYEGDPQDDGVVIRFTTLPGGKEPDLNEGKTLVHEVGHWVGLYHTFQGGCSEPGDRVSDTPQSKSPSYGCQIGRDSCSAPGKDPVTNYMDYSDDACLTNFTRGQIARMKTQCQTFRGISV